MSEYTDISDLWSESMHSVGYIRTDYTKCHPCSVLKHLSTFSFALMLMHSVGSILFKSGSCMVAKAARPRDECRMSGRVGY